MVDKEVFGMKKKEVIEQLVSYIKDLINPQKVILFGSYAYGNLDKDSDIDLLIVADIKDTLQRKHLRSILRRKIPSVGVGKDFG